ncbi:hypothetical protein QR680_000740 [Steinernema hermaphroditum]|uniref:Secreted protein n=1 Tax=Steinernema hermaphroditum TaxID=289476 RepID=A0AA39LEU7_9BILA|nr:hypothetical protein QR680_000740 [Steinernema hermaphroditum]
MHTRVILLLVLIVVAVHSHTSRPWMYILKRAPIKVSEARPVPSRLSTHLAVFRPDYTFMKMMDFLKKVVLNEPRPHRSIAEVSLTNPAWRRHPIRSLFYDQDVRLL